MIKAIAFDFDGLLADTEIQWLRVITEIHTKFGLSWNKTKQSKISGKSTFEVADFIAQKANMDQEFVYQCIIEGMSNQISNSAIKMPGAEKALHTFSSFPTALCSGSPGALLRIFLEKFKWRHFFEIILSCDDLPKGKPAPDVYQAICSFFNIEPHELLVFEDSTNGILSAASCGATIVAIPNNHIDIEREVIQKANYVLSSLEEATSEIINNL